MTSEFVVVFTGDSYEARRAWSVLEGHGIGAKLIDGNVAMLYGGGIGAKIVVAAADADAARDVLVAEGIVAPGHSA